TYDRAGLRSWTSVARDDLFFENDGLIQVIDPRVGTRQARVPDHDDPWMVRLEDHRVQPGAVIDPVSAEPCHEAGVDPGQSELQLPFGGQVCQFHLLAATEEARHLLVLRRRLEEA